MNVSSSYLLFDLVIFYFIYFCIQLRLLPFMFDSTGISLANVGCCFNYINALGKLKSHISDCKKVGWCSKCWSGFCLHLFQLNTFLFLTFSLICKYNLQRSRIFFFIVPLARIVRDLMSTYHSTGFIICFQTILTTKTSISINIQSSKLASHTVREAIHI